MVWSRSNNLTSRHLASGYLLLRRCWNLIVLSLLPILTMSYSPRCWQAGNLPSLNGVMEQRIPLPALPVKLDKHKFLNLEQASLDQLSHISAALRRIFLALPRFFPFPRRDIPETWSYGNPGLMGKAHFLELFPQPIPCLYLKLFLPHLTLIMTFIHLPP